MTDLDMDAIRQRVEKATEGPWEVGDYFRIQAASMCQCYPDYGPLVWEGVRDINGENRQTHIHRRSAPSGDSFDPDTSVYSTTLPYPVVVALSTREYADISREDAEFIAHAREDIPALLAEIDRLNAENEQLRTARIDPPGVRVAEYWKNEYESCRDAVNDLRATIQRVRELSHEWRVSIPCDAVIDLDIDIVQPLVRTLEGGEQND